MARITTITLFKSESLSAGESGTSGVIDLRYCSDGGRYSLSHSIAAGTSTTCGTTTFSYVGSSIFNGEYVNPSTNGTFATSGPTIVGKITPLSPVLAPFMKIVATQTGSGTAGANSSVTAELNVQ